MRQKGYAPWSEEAKRYAKFDEQADELLGQAKVSRALAASVLVVFGVADLIWPVPPHAMLGGLIAACALLIVAAIKDLHATVLRNSE